MKLCSHHKFKHKHVSWCTRRMAIKIQCTKSTNVILNLTKINYFDHLTNLIKFFLDELGARCCLCKGWQRSKKSGNKLSHGPHPEWAWLRHPHPCKILTWISFCNNQVACVHCRHIQYWLHISNSDIYDVYCDFKSTVWNLYSYSQSEHFSSIERGINLIFRVNTAY